MANSPTGDSMTERIVRVLDTFSATRSSQTPAEIGRLARLPPSTAHRIVEELVRTGLLERAEGGVRLGMRLWELALRGSDALRLRQAALPMMEAVQQQFRQHVQLWVLEDDEALCLERLSHPSAGANLATIAGRLPLHASSAGAMLLAHADDTVRRRVLAGPLRRQTPETPHDPIALERILDGARRSGFVVAPGWMDVASVGIAVPVRDAGRVIAVLSVVLPRNVAPEPAVQVMRRAAAGVTERLRTARQPT